MVMEFVNDGKVIKYDGKWVDIEVLNHYMIIWIKMKIIMYHKQEPKF